MQQTSKYQFNLVEGSDDFSPTPLNQNMEKVEEALETIAVTAAEKPYATGNYTGNGGTQTITLGFKPLFVIITGQGYSGGVSTTALLGYIAFSGGSQITESLKLGTTGFTVTHADRYYPATNEENKTYSYIAFR